MSHNAIEVCAQGLRRVLTPSNVRAHLGRDPQADLHVADLRVSRKHLVLEYGGGIGWTLRNVEGSSGTYHPSGERVSQVVVDGPLSLRLGDRDHGPELDVRPWSSDGDAQSTLIAFEDDEIQLGRAGDNDAVLADFMVSEHHALVRRRGSTWEVTDLESRFGVHVDGHRVDQAPVSPGNLLTVGQTVLELGPQGLRSRSPDAPTLECENIVVEAGGKRILDGVSLTLQRGELAAIVGPSGSGKSTLIQILSAATAPAAGRVLVHGLDTVNATAAVRPMVGYVPQDDILHPQLPLQRALRFGAELRFAPDVPEAERDARVDEIMRDLGLVRAADTPIHRLSGGQRKRTSVAMELLTAPSVLLLDEPTSGLDPGFEKSLMQLLRRLADEGRTVVVVTHSVQSLDLCDRLLFLASGGRPAYSGPPQGALPHFGVQDYAEAYQRLEHGDVELPAPQPAAPPPRRLLRSAPKRLTKELWLAQLRTLLRRQIVILAADRRMATYLVASAVVSGLLISLLVTSGVWAADTGGGAGARTLVAALVVTATAIGAANTVREIVKESAILRRERAGGLDPSAYLASKAATWGAITLAQTALLVIVGTARARGPSRGALLPWPGPELLVAVGVAALAAAALGLLLSTVVNSSEKAMALIPMVFIVQWLFSGAALDLTGKPVMEQLSYTASANWGVAAVASTVDVYELERRCGHQPPPGEAGASASAGSQAAEGCDPRWQRGPFRWMASVAATAVICAALLAAAVRRLEMRD